MSAVSLAGAVVARGGREVLHGVDFELGDDEFVAVLGANGAGKSTLVRALVGLTPLSRGTLRLFGEEGPGQRRRFGYVPQRLTTTTGVPATVREVVSSGRTPRLSRWRRTSAADRAAVDAAVAAVGLRPETPVAHLSGGQQQRVLIARAIAGEPDALVLDEPTAGVDAESQEAFASVLADLKQRGVAVLLVTHHLGVLAPLVDRVVVLTEGVVTYDGPVPEHGMADDDHHHPAPPDGSRWGLA